MIFARLPTIFKIRLENIRSYINLYIRIEEKILTCAVFWRVELDFSFVLLLELAFELEHPLFEAVYENYVFRVQFFDEFRGLAKICVC